MNYKARAFAVLVATTISSAAMAVDGAIEFSGEITAETCKAALSGGVTSVTLPTVAAGALTAGQSAGQTAFSIELSNCSAGVKTAAAFFEGGGTVEPGTGNLKNTTSDGSNVFLQLVDAKNGKAIKAGDGSQMANTSRIDVDATTKTAVLPYAVQYFAAAAATPGKVTGRVTYTINYL